MRHRIATIILGAVITAALAAGCASTKPPTPSGSSSSTPSSSSSGGAPHVAKPLDTTKFQAAPCSVLSAAEIQPFGLPATGKAATGALGPACRWSNLDTGVSVNIGFVTANKDGLNSLYQQRDSLELFKPLPDIQGYPAVIYGPIDSRKSGTCNVDIGVADNLNYDVALDASTGPLKADPCDAAQQIATIVLGHLKGGL